MSVQFIMKYLIIFVLIKEINLVNPWTNMEEKDVGLCTKNAALIWKFAWKYFKDMHAAAISAYEDASKDITEEVIKCGMLNPKFSIQHKVSIWNISSERRSLKKSEYFYPNEMNGLIFAKETVENITKIFPPIGQETKVIIILMNATTDDATDTLKSAWSRNKILDLVVFRIAKAINVTQGEISSLYVSAYDPFTIKNGLRGLVHTFRMKNNNESLSKLLNILRTRLVNVHGYPLKVAIFEKNKYEDNACDGLNCEITLTLVKVINFKAVYSLGTYAIQEVDEGNAEILGVMMEMLLTGALKNSIYLFPTEFRGQGFITPKILPSATVSFVKVFSPGVSIALAFAYVAMVMSWRWFQKLNNKWTRNNDRQLNFVEICCNIFGNFLLVSQPGCGDRRYQRCLLISWLLFSMIVCFYYQSTMVEHLNASKQSRYVKTLDDLEENGFKIIVPYFYEVNLITAAADKEAPHYLKYLLKQSTIISENAREQDIMSVVNSRDTVILCDMDPCTHYKFRIQREFGEDNVRILENALFAYYDAFIVSLHSPYKERFNEVLMRIVESNLIRKWRENRNYYLRRTLPESIYNPVASVYNPDVYEMKDLAFIFLSWFGCCFFCFLVFLLELLTFHRHYYKRTLARVVNINKKNLLEQL